MMRLTLLVFCVLAVCFVACQAADGENQVVQVENETGYGDYVENDSGVDEEDPRQEEDEKFDEDNKGDGVGDRTFDRGPPADSKPGAQKPGQEGKKPKMPKTYIMMPSGLSYQITDAAYSYHECGVPAKLVYLSPVGKMGKREYDIVSHEVQKSWQDIEDDRRELKIVKIEKVLNNCLWREYKSYQDKIKSELGYTRERLLFNEGTDFEDIVQTGFTSQNAVDDFLGRGLYFAKDSSTAYWHGRPNYTLCPTCHRVMLLCRVTLGKVWKQPSDKLLPGPPEGFHSVRGLPAEGGLSFEEFAVYNGEQVYPEYLITYKVNQVKTASPGAAVPHA